MLYGIHHLVNTLFLLIQRIGTDRSPILFLILQDVIMHQDGSLGIQQPEHLVLGERWL